MSGADADAAGTAGFARIVGLAAGRYRPAGRTAYHFARGKLGRDPVFAAMLRQGLLADRRRLLDLGCGQGVLEVLLATLETPAALDAWPTHWPPPPAGLAVTALDLRADAVRAARTALAGTSAATRFAVDVGDLRAMPVGRFDAIVILDVLHYLSQDEQEHALDACASALEPGGRLLLRVGDADRGWRFRWTLANDWLITVVRGHRPRFAVRGAADWRALLERRGLAVRAQPMSEGTSFANVLLVADAPDPTAAAGRRRVSRAA